MLQVLIAGVLAAGQALVLWLTRTVIAKMLLYTGIFLFVGEAMVFMYSHLPFGANDDGGVSAAHSSLTSAGWFFYDLFDLGFGINHALTAIAYRFLIRRLPLVG